MIAHEIINRKRIKNSLIKRFDLEKICFKEQLNFINDPSPFVIADCSRRSGKTEVCAYDLIKTCIENNKVTCLYITLTRANAGRIIWNKLLEICEKYFIKCTINISKLSITFFNGSVIYLSGCKDRTELDKFRGLALKLIYIDEVQSFKKFIKDLVDEVLAPSTMDYAGKIKFIGTPNAIKSGFFWELKNNKAYSHHHWTFWQNPFIAQKSGVTHDQIMQRELKRRGISIDHPSIRREWFGEWTNDTESLVLIYNEKLNHYDVLPFKLDYYIIGIHFGTDDNDSISVLGWAKGYKKIFLVDEFVKNNLTVSQICDEVQKLIDRYDPMRVVADTGANGKKIALEMTKRTGVPIHAADKQRKIEHITWLNDAMRTGNFFAKKTSVFAQDCMIVEWDFEKSSEDKLVIKDEPHSDAIDSTLYAFTECLAYLEEEKKPKKKIGKYVDVLEKELSDNLEKQIEYENQKELTEKFFNDFMYDEADHLKNIINSRRK